MTRRDGFGTELVGRAIKELQPVIHIERASTGVSTEVYKLKLADNTNCYLRVGEEGSSLAPEMKAHQLAIENGAKVPVIISFEEQNIDLERSILITTETSGGALSDKEGEIADQILIQAGRDLALINQIKVNGFGLIITESGSTELNAQHKSYTEFVLGNVDHKVDVLVESTLINEEGAKKIRGFLEHNRSSIDEVQESILAHGDFDLTHVFENNGEYTGIIDFGEIQGASIYRDLAHFYVYSQKHIDTLIEGYKQITDLPDDYMRRIKTEAVVFAINKLAKIAEFQPERLSKFRKLLRVITDEVLNDR